MQKYNERNSLEQEAIRISRALLLGTAFGTAICAALLALCAMALVKTGSLPLQAVPIITIGIGTIGAFFSGYIAVAAYKKRGLLIGCIAGLMLFLVVLIIGLSNNAESNIINAITKCVIFTILGGIGGVVKVNKKKKSKKY